MEQKNITQKLLKLMNEIGRIKKDKENNSKKYRYVSSDRVLMDVQKACIELSVVSYCEMSIDRVVEQKTQAGATQNLVFVRCALHVIDQESGEEIIAYSLGEGTDYGDKAVMKAETAALKYAWLQTLNISTGDDPEADEETDKHVGKAVADNQFARDGFREDVDREHQETAHESTAARDDGKRTILIKDVESVKWTAKSTGKPMEKWVVTDEHGNKYETINKKLGAWCDVKAGTKVAITYKYSAQYKENDLLTATEDVPF